MVLSSRCVTLLERSNILDVSSLRRSLIETQGISAIVLTIVPSFSGQWSIKVNGL